MASTKIIISIFEKIKISLFEINFLLEFFLKLENLCQTCYRAVNNRWYFFQISVIIKHIVALPINKRSLKNRENFIYSINSLYNINFNELETRQKI